MAKWDLDKIIRPDEIVALQSKNSKQRTEIARLTQKLERVTKEKLSLLSDIKFLRGES
mgnify:FL=1